MTERLLLPMKEVAVLHGEEILYRAEHVTERYGVSTGYEALDSFLRGGGLLPGLLYSVGARPGMGKTQFLLNILLNIAEQAIPVAFFSLELAKLRVLERLAYLEAGIDYQYHWQNKKPFSSEQLKAIEEAIRHIQTLPFYIRDTVRMQPREVRYTMEREKDLGVQVIGVDYLHIMGTETKEFGRERQIGTTVEAVRDHAKELGLACLLACQLNREVEEHAPYIPSLANFRDSGAIEQTSYAVMALYRQDLYALQGKFNQEEHDYVHWKPDGTPQLNGKMDCYFLKQQDGPIGKVTLKFEAETGRINE